MKSGDIRDGYSFGGAFVYVALCGIGGHALAKVGVSGHPEKRIAQLQTGCPLPIGSCYISEFRTRAKALQAEHLVHARLSRNRTCGEWFKFHESSLDGLFSEAESACREVGGTDLERMFLPPR